MKKATMKKFVSLASAAVMAVSAVPFAASADDSGYVCVLDILERYEKYCPAVDLELYPDRVGEYKYEQFGKWDEFMHTSPYTYYRNDTIGVEFVLRGAGKNKEGDRKIPKDLWDLAFMGDMDFHSGAIFTQLGWLENRSFTVTNYIPVNQPDEIASFGEGAIFITDAQFIYTDVDGEVYTFDNSRQAVQLIVEKYSDCFVDPSEWDAIQEKYCYDYDVELAVRLQEEEYKQSMESAVTLSGEETATIENETDLRTGDVNMDGLVDLTDAVVMSKICTGSIQATAAQLAAGDCNADGVMDDADIEILLKFVVGLIDVLPYVV